MELQIKGYGEEVKRGRPKGSSSGSKAARKTKQEELNELLHPKLGVIKEVRRVKFRTHKNPWELEEEFRREFLDGDFKVLKSFVVANEGYLLMSKLDGDIEYQPY